jgi:hypothetical protein
MSQINVVDQAAWQRLTEGIQLYNLGGLTTTTSRPDDFVEMADFDFVFDLSADIRRINGGSTSVHSTVNVATRFPSWVLPHMPMEWLLPSVQFEVIQIVFERFGALFAGATSTNAQPGFGFVGTFGTGGPVISQGARAVVRYRFYRPWMVKPMLYAPTDETQFSSFWETTAPMVAWERRWALRLPRQDAYDRAAIDIEPMANTYTFSVVPQYPYSFSFTFSRVLSPEVPVIKYAVTFDPNEVAEMQAPYVGVVANQRREVLTIESQPTPTSYLMQFFFTQKCRVYIRVEDSAASDVRMTWSDLRNGEFNNISIPGYDTSTSPPVLLSRARELRGERPEPGDLEALLAHVRDETAVFVDK